MPVGWRRSPLWIGGVALITVRALLLIWWPLGLIDLPGVWFSRVPVLDVVVLVWVVYASVVTGWRNGFGGVAVAAAVGVGDVLWAAGADDTAIAVFGAAGMAVGFAVGLWLIKAVLSPGSAVLGVARIMIDEAIRMKVALVFVIALALIVPVLPLLLDPDELLQYRVQFFLTWSLSCTSVLLSLMTVLLACGTICHEVEHGQVFLTMTKPIGRGSYLLGKWLGLVLLNLLLLGVAGGGVYTFAVLLQRQPARDRADRQAVDKQVMVARVAIEPRPAEATNLTGRYNLRLKALRRESPDRFEGNLSAADRQGIMQQVVAEWHVIEPLNAESFLFTGLDRARRFQQPLQFRFKPVATKTPADQRVRLAMWLNGRPYPVDAETGRHLPIVAADRTYHVVNLPVIAADERGDLEVRIANLNLDNPDRTFRSSISFTPNKGLELLYRVGGFEPNLARALMMIWVRQWFLAMLGIAAGTFLGFPVACLLSLLIYLTAIGSGFLAESLLYYVTLPTSHLSWGEKMVWVPREFLRKLVQGEEWDAIKIVIRLVGGTFVSLIPALSDYNPVPMVADGRLIEPRALGVMVGKIGLVWTGLCALLGWLVFRRRELAGLTV